jgi:[acyl-carrier-protein] S-malonyltransferase
MKRAIVFPGQGSQAVGMGRQIAEAFTSARLVFEEVDDALGQKLSSVMFAGSEEELTLTQNAQPAIMACSIAVFRALEKEAGWKPSDYANYFAGHSLGEYTALCAAGSLSLADTARLLRLRGQAMQKAVPEDMGAMAALLGFGAEKALKVIGEASQFGVCSVANDNSPEQVVVSGEKEAVQRVADMALKAGAKKAVMLQVSAPFHSPLMQPAAEVMQEALMRTDIRVPALPIIANVTASATHDPDEMRDLLVKQVCGMVRWRESVQYMARQGVTFALELGAGKVLSGLIRRTEPSIGTLAVSIPADIEAFERVV